MEHNLIKLIFKLIAQGFFIAKGSLINSVSLFSPPSDQSEAGKRKEEEEEEAALETWQ